eukprot:CAMPEP_0202964138 /NCGR_PEP_ID=MMETSP1396-20130829/8214_1 /ASSEMBLY_ACC=CAM_ASM_000872 /TAXON_ID= /ORGANISM="Pseudokeronopsis sp., Strain Brazil" /LENGTH=76 /DNA_ID=CAMNT_0049686009 /DNA_START=142 /DNA_END=372 /DNA_ORIENTATION=-
MMNSEEPLYFGLYDIDTNQNIKLREGREMPQLLTLGPGNDYELEFVEEDVDVDFLAILQILRKKHPRSPMAINSYS